MQNAGYAALEVIPSFKGIEGRLESGTSGPLNKAGLIGGKKFGDAAGKTMTSTIRSHAKAAAALVGAGFVAAGLAAIKFGKDSVQGYEDHLRVVGITKSTIKATGQAAHVTAKQVGNLSDKLEQQTGVDGDLIQSGANMLLTFKNVRNEQGKNNDIFDQSLSVLTDMSTAMGTDAKSGAIQLGKALNDPVKGISALSRVGVTFDKQQQDQIKNFVEQGKVASAQKIILGELTSEFGGAARAQRTVGDQVTVAYHRLQDEVGKAALPVVRDFERFLAKKGIPTAERLFGQFEKKGIPAIHKFVDESKPMVHSILPAASTAFHDIAGFLKDAAPYAKKTIDAFNSLPSWAQKSIVLGTAGGVLAKKTGLLSVGTKALTGGNGTTGLLGLGKPVHVWVDNPEFGGGAGGGGKGAPVVTGAGAAAESAAREAEAVKAAKAAAAAVKAAGGDVAAQSSAAARAFKEALNVRDAATLKEILDFGIKGGTRGLLRTVLAAPAGVTLGDQGNEVLQPGKLQLTGKDFLASIKAGKIKKSEELDPDVLKLFDLSQSDARALLGRNIEVVTSTVDALKQHVEQASAAIDLTSRRGSQNFGGLSGKIDATANRTSILDRRLRGLPATVRTELSLDDREARRRLAAFRAEAQKSLDLEIAGPHMGRPGDRQSALDGVRR